MHADPIATSSDPCVATVADAMVRLGTRDSAILTMARTPAQRLRAWRLTCVQYLAAGLANERPDGLWYGAFDLLPSTRCLLLSDDGGNDLATFTVVADGTAGLPADSLYRDELDHLRAAGCRLQEVISLAISEPHPRLGPVRLFQLYRACVAAAVLDGRDGVVITVHPRHAPFYRRSLGYRQIGGERSYDRVGGAPAVLLHQDLRDAAHRFAAQPSGCPAALWQALRDHPRIETWSSILALRASPSVHQPTLEIA